MSIDKLKINTELIANLKPCHNRFDNWRIHYDNFNGTIIDFLELEKITHRDKIWVSVRVLPRELVEVFAIDCAFSASATYAAADAAYAAATDAAAAYAAAERENQVDALIMLIKGWKS